ncbi:hypothetical protein, partial [Mycoplasma tauri]|uniref:hypothetical protein n=1 Tax=Mycoplasma tauri TaxID=547987 RepID=UPI001CBAA44A
MKKINKVILSLSASATLPLVFVSSSCGDSKTAGDKKKDDVEALDDSLIKSGEEALSDIDSKLKLNYHYLSGFKNDISSLLDTYKKRSTNDNKNILQQKINYYNSKKEEFLSLKQLWPLQTPKAVKSQLSASDLKKNTTNWQHPTP